MCTFNGTTAQLHRALSNYSAVEPPGKQWAAQGLLLAAACLQLLLWVILGTAVTWWHLSTKNGWHARGVQDSAAKQHHPPGVSSQQDPCTHQHQLPIRPVQASRHIRVSGMPHTLLTTSRSYFRSSSPGCGGLMGLRSGTSGNGWGPLELLITLPMRTCNVA